MLCEGGMIDEAMTGGRIGGLQIIAEGYKNFSYAESFQDNLKKRGVDAESFPVTYPYRDDAGVVSALQTKFVKEVLGVYYKSDSDIEQDYELQAFIKEVNEQCGKTKGHPFPEIKTLDQLSNVVSNVIFQSTLLHSLLNYGQFDFYAFAPNYPLTLRQPPPTSKDVTEADVLAALVNDKQILGMIGMAHLLSTPSQDTMMQHPPKKLYKKLGHPDARAAVARFDRGLREATDQILQQIENRVAEYRARFPDAPAVPKSVEFPYCNPWLLAISIQI
eukprot:TRINITY_DN888_c0_g2_i1.p1 TRINITY_DN888_c0_g2~~TRINITY_DN888_c0_g2_i1.p1  ORF type:complete len:275 (-),score=71.57 TRINITY_DN888_c0_g2_i1:105-929(-)